MKQIYPSLISADLLNLGSVIKNFNPVCDGFHIDIMDNHFVPNLTWGADLTNAISRASHKPLWVHLMVEKPDEWLPILDLTPGSILTFHFESNSEKIRLIHRIKEKNLKAGIAINPKTSVEQILPFADLVDQILVMSVEPGFSGQDFNPDVLAKLDPLLFLRKAQQLNFTIAMDGGINAKNIHMLAQKGVDEFGVASAIFNDPNPIAAYEKLKKLT